jgi:hypothetical protein
MIFQKLAEVNKKDKDKTAFKPLQRGKTHGLKS